MNNITEQKGFTLVELAIVMIIIGLLIGGVLKGQELINNAQVTSTVAKIRSVEVSVFTFQDMFSSYPGDMESPTARLPACPSTTPCGAVEGSAGLGNGYLEELPGFFSGGGTEPVAFWGQLAAAELITGININPSTPAINGGDELLNADVGGIFTMGYMPASGGGLNGVEATNYTARNGHYLAIHANGGDAGTDGNILTPSIVARLDRKLDDGQPNSGILVVAGPADVCSTGSGDTDIYAEYESAADCSLYYLTAQ